MSSNEGSVLRENEVLTLDEMYQEWCNQLRILISSKMFHDALKSFKIDLPCCPRPFVHRLLGEQGSIKVLKEYKLKILPGGKGTRLCTKRRYLFLKHKHVFPSLSTNNWFTKTYTHLNKKRKMDIKKLKLHH